MTPSQFIAALIGIAPLPADHCDCPLCSKVKAARQRFEAAIMLADRQNHIIVPTSDEWIGLNLNEMDGEL